MEAAETTTRSKKSNSKSTMSKWYFLYFTLAAFDLFTVSLSLYLNHNIAGIFEDSVDVNMQWSELNNNFMTLNRLATDVNAPGNNVFETRSIALEFKTLVNEYDKYQGFKDDIQTIILQETVLNDSNREILLNSLDSVNAYVKNMFDNSVLIFSHLESNKNTIASKHMSIMDSEFYNAQQEIMKSQSLILTEQEKSLKKQAEDVNLLKRLEILIAIFITIMIVGITFYGRGLFRMVINSEKEKELAYKEIEESSGKLNAFVENAADAIIRININGGIESFNQAAENIFGYTAKEVIGKNVDIFIPKGSLDHNTILENALDKRVHAILGKDRALTAVRKNGQVFPIEISVTRYGSGSDFGYYGIIRDITERQRIEKLKNEFISTVSHELRTPLTSIKGSLGLLGSDVLDADKEKRGEILGIASRNTDRLLMLINDLLDIQKIGEGEMEYHKEPIKLSNIIASAVEMNRPFAENLGVTLKVESSESDVTVKVDEKRIEQVMANLLSNAAKFSEEGSCVDIFSKVTGNNVYIYVKDYGEGIPLEYQSKVFTKFSQADSSSSRKHAGTGLGLNISKEIIKAHDGDLNFDTEPGKGSTFYFNLPYNS